MEFIKLLKNPENIDQEQLSYLRSIIDNYPYIQSSRAIYLKGLKKSGSFKFDKELKITAAHTTHRNVLFDYINDIDSSKIDNKNEKETHKTSTNKKSFSEWLSLSNVSPIDRSNENVSKSTDSAMINDFIEKNPKGGGLSSSFGGGGSQQVGGVKQTTDFLDKTTWYLALFLIALVMASNFTISDPKEISESKALNVDQVENQALPFNNDSEELKLPETNN